MSYTVKNDQQGLAAGEVAVVLDSGETVAVAVAADTEETNNNVTYTATARQIDAAGVTVLSAAGTQVTSGFTHCSPPAETAALGSGAIRRLMAQAVLGSIPASPPPPIIWGSQFMADASIRFAISAAAVAGSTLSLSSLL